MIRLAQGSDAPEVAEIYAPFVRDTAISFEEVEPPASEMRARIEDVLGYAPWLVHVEHGRILGYAYACQHRSRAAYRWSIDASVYVRPEAQRRGIARGLYEKLFEVCRRQGYCSVFAGITLPNDPSVAFHEKLGFEPVGRYRNVGYKHGIWRDTGWWQRALAAPRENPPEPARNVAALLD